MLRDANKPRPDPNLFRNNLESAWMAAEGTPSNYYLARTITGSCTSCHIVH